jgi:hypothetical protein
VSHRPERKEKNCLNCGTIVVGKYCHNCGQENTDPGMTLWGLFQHFFYDITHFDGKYFDTLRHLFTKPGFLSKAFMDGKRASFVDPVKMYIFTSAFFFLLFYSFFLKVDEKDMESGLVTINDLENQIRALDSSDNKYDFRNNYLILNKSDTLLDMRDAKAVRYFRDSLNLILKKLNKVDSLFPEKGMIRILNLSEYTSRNEYDSLQKILPEAQRDSRLTRLMVYRQIDINEKYDGDLKKYIAGLLNKFLHSFPTLLFISLPLLTSVLSLLYIRIKKYLYVNHGIFLVHQYIFTFLLLIPFFLTYEAAHYMPWKIWSFVRIGIFIWLSIYLYRSMRVFYVQSRLKTTGKLILFLFFSLFIMLLIFILYFAYMALKG